MCIVYLHLIRVFLYFYLIKTAWFGLWFNVAFNTDTAISWCLFIDILFFPCALCQNSVHILVPVTDNCLSWGWIRSEWERKYVMNKHITNYESGCQTHDLWIGRPHNTYEIASTTFLSMHYLTTCSMGHNTVILEWLVTKHVMLIRYVLIP